MAIIHRAYSFRPKLFHLMLQEELVDHDQLRLDLLHDLVKLILASTSETTRQALEDIGFEDDWLDTSDDEVSRTDEWYMIALSQALSPVPSLSNRLPVSHIVLRLVLPLAGWADVEIEKLLRGEILDTLVQSSGNPLFIAEFRGLKQYGGWLSFNDVKTLFSRLKSVESYFSSPSREVVSVLNSLAVLWSQSPGEMTKKAYADSTEMLQTAIEKNSALFLLLD